MASPYYLTYQENGIPKKIPVENRNVLMGRAPDCDMILTQAGISRHHCRLSKNGDTFVLEDLNSKNGTKVNNIYIKSVQLEPEDVIQIGEYNILFRRELSTAEAKQVILSEEKELYEEAGTIIRRVNELKDLIAQYEKNEFESIAPNENVESGRRILTVLIEVAKALLTVKSLNEIIQKVMDLIFEYLPADRGFLMLANEHQFLEPKVVKHRDPNKAENIEISKTIAEKVFNEDVAILTTDAQVDPRFSAGESIRFLGIKSAMCVPLFHKNKTIGIIYLDSPTSTAAFGAMHLDMLTALANFAAVGIEQAQLTEKIERESKIRAHLERYQSPSVVSRILQSADAALSNEMTLSVQERDVSVLFADVVGFTPMAEKMSPSRVALLLNAYFSEMTDIIFRYDGTLDKFIGDAIMAIFGAPTIMEDHPIRAVQTGLDMLERLNIMNANRNGEAQFSIRIGINSGRVVAGDIGSTQRMEYTVLGNTVNLASRIESMACKPNQLCIGTPTYDRVKDLFECEDLGPMRLKGITEEMNIYRVIRRK
ncbi:MAG: FHA domain-containing protein [Acidobacteria bacterium]|nr:FHA domain-containing protein [Acidobacteriota bacterium]MCB9396829.1 FHA domain-containing protein [Acidobacteriota bacterium]